MTREVAPLRYIDDVEMRLKRQDAWWDYDIIDHVPVLMSIPSGKNLEFPKKEHSSYRERTFDTQFLIDCMKTGVENTIYLGDAIPHCYINMGPEVFSGFFGTEIEYGPDTSWSIPNLLDWSDVDNIKFDENNFFYKKMDEMMLDFIAGSEGLFYTGMTDIHPGGDAIAAFRDPAELNIDMIEYTDEVKKLLKYVTDCFIKYYDHAATMLEEHKMPISAWCGITSTKRWYVPSNDFSCMVSPAMFDDVFLPELARECKSLESSVYHLDGPGAIKHLDSLLTIKELNAIQWVYTADGIQKPSDWMHLYKKVQKAGKGLQISINISELDYFMEELSPQGIWLGVGGISTKDEADAVIKRLLTWK